MPRRKKPWTMPDEMKPKFGRMVIYTDGACSKNGKPGARAGYGVFFGDGNYRNVSKPVPGHKQTNNTGEMYAFICALRFIESSFKTPLDEFVIASDSKYCIKGWHEHVKKWSCCDWVTSTNTPVCNKSLWVEILRLKLKLENVHVVYVPGHSDVYGNDRADELAVAGACKHPDT